MRVIAGKCRSLNLVTPKGMNTRPTQDRIKETLFNMIQNDIGGCVFIDVFAGSGGIGIEALSRGAKHCYFIDNDREAADCINHNLRFTKLSNDATLLRNDFLASLSLINEEEVDIIFADPPYEAGFETQLFECLKTRKYVTDNTVIILEAALTKDFEFEGFELIKEKRYKTNKHLFFRRK